ncbi:hypothetical protein V8C40DRAFT_244761 [Trichoderma camerunense]
MEVMLSLSLYTMGISCILLLRFCYRPASDLGLGMYDLSDAKAASDQFKCSPQYWSFLFWTNIYDQQGPSMQY